MPRTCALLLLWMIWAVSQSPLSARAAQPAAGAAPAKQQAAPVILVPEKFDPILKASVQDLQRLLSKMTGQSVVVSTAASSVGEPFIAVGDHPLVRQHLAKDTFDPASPESYAIVSVAGGLLLTGASAGGSSLAIYQWLHNLGCRWFFPGAAWEHVPPGRAIDLAGLNIRGKPKLIQRRLWYGWGVATPENRRDHEDWQRRNRLGGQLSGAPGHAYANIADPDELFSAHPEWFALVKGKRSRDGQLCLSNPELQRHAVAWALEQVKQRPTIDLISASPNDGGGYCECDPCAAMGSRADQTLTLANLMADAVSKVKPDCYVGMYAYYANCMPPTFRAHPKVVIYVANGFIAGGFSFEELLEGWTKMADNLAVREYFDVMIWSRDRPQWKVERFAQAFALYGKYNVTGVTGEASNNWGPQGLNYYVIARLMWDPKADVAAVIDDFFTTCWQQAAGPLRDYYRTWKHLPVRPWSIGIAYQHLDQAAQLAADDPILRARVDLLRSYLHWLWLYTQHSENGPAEHKVATARRALHFSWRLANTNMVHSYGHYREDRMWSTPGVSADHLAMWKRTDQPVEEYTAPDVAQRLNVPDEDAELDKLVLEEPKPKLPPIELLPVLPRDMVQALAEEDAKQLPRITPVDLPDFSTALTPLPAPAAPAAAAPAQPEQAAGVWRFPSGSSLLHLWVSGPGSIRIEVEGAAKEGAAEAWRLLDRGNNRTLASGDLAVAQPALLTLPLPAAGLYSFSFKSKRERTMRLIGGNIRAVASAGAVALPPGKTRYFFWVPAGVKSFLIEGHSRHTFRPIRLAALTIAGRDGQPLLQAPAKDLGLEVWTITVPAGQAGAVWSLDADVAGEFFLQFFGIPALVATTADSLLIPGAGPAAATAGSDEGEEEVVD